MDVLYRLGDQDFVWDSEKATSNNFKHGVDFKRACEVFFDPLVMYEDAGVDEEVRTAAVGIDFGFKLLFVVHAVRSSGMYRIISARPAQAKEKKLYEEYE